MTQEVETALLIFRISDLEVFSVSADFGPSESPHVSWTVGYAPELDAALKARVIIATLHTVGSSGRGTIHVGALLLGEAGAALEGAELERQLSNSDALETLYDFARVSLRSVLAVVDADAAVSRESPSPTFGVLERTSASDPSPTNSEA